MLKKSSILSLIILISVFALSNFAFASKGDNILKKSEKIGTPKTSYAVSTMYVYKDAKVNDYRKVKSKGYAKGSDYQFSEFIYPKSVGGMRMLNKNDDIWIYFPSTGRIRKIAESAKKQSIKGVGGDFSYDDLSTTKYSKKYNAKIKKTMKKGWILTLIPKKGKSTTYSKIEVVMSKDYRIIKSKMFDENSKHIKTLYFKNYKTIKGYKIPFKLIMYNHKKISKTLVVTNKIKVNIKVKNSYFNPDRLEE